MPGEQEVPPDLLATESWLREHRSHSVTELEVLHGVLRNPKMAGHAFFYFRAPAYIAALPDPYNQYYKAQGEFRGHAMTRQLGPAVDGERLFGYQVEALTP